MGKPESPSGSHCRPSTPRPTLGFLKQSNDQDYRRDCNRHDCEDYIPQVCDWDVVEVFLHFGFHFNPPWSLRPKTKRLHYSRPAEGSNVVVRHETTLGVSALLPYRGTRLPLVATPAHRAISAMPCIRIEHPVPVSYKIGRAHV